MGTAVVSGTASGLGAAIRARLEQDGDRVIGIDLHKAEIETDLSTPEGRREAVERSLEASGGRIDRVVACAGLGSHLEDIGLIARVNYFGAIELLDGLFEALQTGERPAALALCSNSAQMAPLADTPFVQALLAHDEGEALRALEKDGNGFVAYAGSKMALGMAVRRRAGTWGRAGVRLNAIAPGPTKTPMLAATFEHPVYGKGAESLDIPLERHAEPEEISAVAGFLLGPDASYVHGSIWYVDGGNDAAIRPDRF
jgi:NAD(P)-dependent dehydrogenase (short-subunit alcohol dehydrogenase family)